MEKQIGLGTGREEEKKLEQMWRTPHSLVSSVSISPVYPFSYVYWAIAEHTGPTIQYIHTYDYHQLKETWGLSNCSTEMVKVMELEIIAHCFCVPTVANHSQLQPVCSALYTLHRSMKVFDDRIVLIVMTMKRITLFWIVCRYFLYTVNEWPALLYLYCLN